MILFCKKTYNFLYWLIHKPFGIIAIRSFTFQKWDRIKNYNLGDDLNFYFLKLLAGKPVINYNDMSHFRLPIDHYTCIGSVFERSVDSSSIVWGTGSLFGGKRNLPSPKRICAVRGPLTRQVLLENGIACPEVYGDPALLLPLVYRPKVKKKYKIGLIPHYIDLELGNVKALCEKSKDDVRLIKMQGYKDWKDVISDICSCECIVSSSLHGIIISDAFQIPNVWIRLSDNIVGGNFKFLDYFASVGRNDNVPLDFKGKEIDLEHIDEWKKKYKPVRIDLSKLIGVCPFLSKKRKKQFIKRILTYMNE